MIFGFMHLILQSAFVQFNPLVDKTTILFYLDCRNYLDPHQTDHFEKLNRTVDRLINVRTYGARLKMRE